MNVFVYVHSEGGLVDGVSVDVGVTKEKAIENFKKYAATNTGACDGLYECGEDGNGKCIASCVDGEFN